MTQDDIVSDEPSPRPFPRRLLALAGAGVGLMLIVFIVRLFTGPDEVEPGLWRISPIGGRTYDHCLRGSDPRQLVRSFSSAQADDLRQLSFSNGRISGSYVDGGTTGVPPSTVSVWGEFSRTSLRYNTFQIAIIFPLPTTTGARKIGDC